MRKPVQQNNLFHLLPYLHPWHCLVCCNGFGGDGFPERVLSYFRGTIFRQYAATDKADNTDGDSDQEINEIESIEAVGAIRVLPQVPEHVSTILHGGAVAPRDLNLAGLVIVREP